ncbi:MAG: hypothetical protein ACYCU5_14315 [Actinomycetes bacterium]
MNIVASLFALSLVAQKVSGFLIQTVFGGKLPAYGKQLVALVIGEAFAFLVGLNVLPAIAQTFGGKSVLSIPTLAGVALTGILVAGGSNLIYDIFPKPAATTAAGASAPSTKSLW